MVTVVSKLEQLVESHATRDPSDVAQDMVFVRATEPFGIPCPHTVGIDIIPEVSFARGPCKVADLSRLESRLDPTDPYFVPPLAKCLHLKLLKSGQELHSLSHSPIRLYDPFRSGLHLRQSLLVWW